MWKNNTQRNIVKALTAWYKRRGRTLPWRLPVRQAGGISNSYRILISEVMLQQTQVSRVLVKYPEFLRRYPTLQALARARQRGVVIAWQGMGYNNRAVRLHKLAREVMQRHGGTIPADFDSLRALPGIGRYTANALLSSAFGKRVAIVDVNVQRVLSRIFRKMSSTAEMRSAKEIWQLADAILPGRNVYHWNQALMDFGATVCTAQNPKCDTCPVARSCASRRGMKRTPSAKPRREPGLDEIPNRLYRGRIIQQLRNLNGTGSIRADVLGRTINSNFSKRHTSWLNTLLSDLEKDGLIRVKGNGTLKSCRVALA